MPVSTSIQRLHLYQIVYKKPGASGMEVPNNSNVSLDGERVGSLAGNQYACVTVSPGTHILRVGHEAFTIDIDPAKERYVRVVLPSVEGGDRTVSVTDGYELATQALTPGHFKQQSGVSWFDSIQAWHEHTNGIIVARRRWPMSLLVACGSLLLQRHFPGLLLRVAVSMKQREESRGFPPRRTYAAWLVAFSLVLASCRSYVHSVRPGATSSQELINSKVTILPAGTPVHVRLLQTLNTHESAVLENVHFQVTSNVRVGDFTVIERGTNAMGRAYITSPDFLRREAQIYLVIESTSAATGTEIPLGGILNETGGGYCPTLDCLGEGGHVAVGAGTEIEAFVAEDVALSAPKLQAFATEKWRRSARLIADQRLRMRVQIYLLPTDGPAQTRVFFDGRKIGRVGPGEYLTLLPSPGKHVIAVNDDRLALELAPIGQYYIRVSETGSWPRTKAHLKLVAPGQGQDDITDLVGVPVDQH